MTLETSSRKELQFIYVQKRIKGPTRLAMTSAYAQSLNLLPYDKVSVRMGSTVKFIAEVHIKEYESGSPPVSLLIGSNCRAWVPTSMYLHMIWSASGKSVKVGPVIGIYTNSTKLLFGSQCGTFKDLMKVGRRRGALVYAFTPEDVDWSSGTIRGYHYVLTKGGGLHWIRKSYPIPDVVYNRVAKRSDEARPSVLHVKNRLLAVKGLKLFNMKFLDKWEVHRCLVGEPGLHDSVIDTMKCNGTAPVMRLLQRHGQVFLKPAANSLGNGAMRVRRMPAGFSWELNIPGKGTKRKNVMSKQSLCSLITKTVREKPYLVQKCISLAKVKGRPFDVRVLVQKDSTAQWKVTGMAARIAQKNRITTHIPNGGCAQPLPKTLQEAFMGKDIDTGLVEKKICDAALMSAKAVDSNSNSQYGELSMDIGVDTAGNVWIFEVNSKPFRFDEERIRQTSLRRVIEYSTNLAGFIQPPKSDNGEELA